jgi:transcriptional regulator with XRE-family HTH domain
MDYNKHPKASYIYTSRNIMSQTQALVTTLKRELRAHGITYAQVARHLGLSENSIKRLFAEQQFSLHRLEQVCQLLQLELSDLVQKMTEDSQRIEVLSEQQEKEIANDIKLLLVATCLLNRWKFAEILQAYTLSETEGIQLLAKLDRLKIIELLPLNRVKLIVAKNFRWRPNGPIQQYFQKTIQPDFFRTPFTAAGEKLVFSSGMLSRGSNASMMKKLERLVAEFNELHNEDVGLPLEQRFGTSMVVALRAWEFGLFRKLRRNPDAKPF